MRRYPSAQANAVETIKKENALREGVFFVSSMPVQAAEILTSRKPGLALSPARHLS